MSVSIIIKALNEERHIARAIESALAALDALTARGRTGEVILADSRSTDRTIEVASAYPIRIVQLSRADDRGCGTGPQLGFQYARGAYIGLIDGDMALDPDFLVEACAFLDAHPEVAGVGGGVRERNLVSIEFERRQKRGARDLLPGAVDRLNGGGLYRRAAIESVGHFSDRNLHGYEEFDLAVRLRGRGWALHRLAIPFVDHYGHVTGGYRLLWRRFRSRYILGIGEVLRGAFGRPHFRQTLRDLPEIRLWFGVYAGWAATAAVVVAAPSGALAPAAVAGLIALPVLALALKYRSAALGVYGFVSWNAHAVGMAAGLLRRRVPPDRWIESRELEPGRDDAPREPVSAATAGPAPRARIAAALVAVVAAATVVPAARPARAETRPEWVAVRDASLVIAPGGPLDFSRFFPAEPAGASGRVIARPDGRLAVARRPDRPVPFLCASLAWSPASGGYPDHATADLYAEQLRVHGYNAARLHFVDANLMTGRRADFDYDPVALDRFRYLLAALKRNGIYWVVDAMTSPNGGYGNVFPDRWVERYDLKLDVHVDDAARRHWRRLVGTMLGTVNPYTGASPLADPAMALVVLVNENGLAFDAIIDGQRTGRAYPARLRPAFNAWLRAKYGSDAALGAAWPDLDIGESLDDGGVALPGSRDARGPRMRDLQAFFQSREIDTVAWMSREIRKLGYSGLVTAYNNGLSAEADAARAVLPAIAVDTYHDEVVSLAVPSTITQTSSLDGALAYIRRAMGVRRLDRPFVVTEYDHLFWNRFRHEAGLAFPAYAALQGWDLICRHAPGAIDLTFDQPWPHKRAILPYGLGLDPVGRASETLAALLFRRGDARAALGTVAVPFGEAEAARDDGLAAMPDALTELGLVSRFGLYPADRPAPAGSVAMALSPPAAAAGPRTVRVAATAGAAAREGTPDLATGLDRLRRAGLLPAANRTDPAATVFESDTGQISLDARARVMTLVAPRTEAASFAAVRAPLRLGALTVEAASGPALVGLSALDGAPVRDSRRLLLIFATDATNTGIVFRDPDRRTVEDFGHMPVLIQRGTLRLRFDTDAPSAWRLSSLHLDGSPGDRLATEAGAGHLLATIDNGTLSHGPTTFFLLERAALTGSGPLPRHHG